MTRRNTLTLALLLAIAPSLALAQQRPPKIAIDATARKTVIDGLSKQLQKYYVFPDVAKQVSASLAAKEASGGYANAKDSDAFAQALSEDLRTFGKDLHFRVGYAPDFKPTPKDGVPDAKQAEEIRQEISSRGFGIESVRRIYLPMTEVAANQDIRRAYLAL